MGASVDAIPGPPPAVESRHRATLEEALTRIAQLEQKVAALEALVVEVAGPVDLDIAEQHAANVAEVARARKRRA